MKSRAAIGPGHEEHQCGTDDGDRSPSPCSSRSGRVGLDPSLGSPHAIRSAVNGAEVLRAGNQVRQVSTLDGLVDIRTTGTNRFDMHYYHAADRGPVADGLYTMAAGVSPFSTITVSYSMDPADGEQLRIEEAFGNSTSVYRYVRSPDSGDLSLLRASGTGQRVESMESRWLEHDRVREELRTVRDGDGVVLERRILEYTVFPWGEELTREVLDPDGEALASTYLYFDDPVANGGNYGMLRQRVDEDGNWERFLYDGAGRPTNVVARFMDAPVGAPAGQSRETRIDYGQVDGDVLVTT